jgi:hypothetical protein
MISPHFLEVSIHIGALLQSVLNHEPTKEKAAMIGNPKMRENGEKGNETWDDNEIKP